MTFDDENDINIQNNTQKNKPKENDFYSTTIQL